METNYFYSQLNYPLPRTAIEAKILLAARVTQVRFLERLSGKTPLKKSSSGKKIGAESAVPILVYLCIVLMVHKYRQSARRKVLLKRNILAEVFPLTAILAGSGKTMPFEKRRSRYKETAENKAEAYRVYVEHLFSACDAVDARIFSKGDGNMTRKMSTTNLPGARGNAYPNADLDYSLDYEYDPAYAHRLVHAGNRYYRYDANGNITAEKDGPFTEDDEFIFTYSYDPDTDVYGTDYGFGLDAPKETEETHPENLFAYRRNYTWNEKNLLTKSSDRSYTVHYRYGEDGQRALKYTEEGRSETLYFNNFYTIHIPVQDKNNPQGLRVHKHIFVGNSRLVTAMTHTDNNGDNAEQREKRYYYHSDHLGSAQFVTDWRGRQYEHIEYTPYGELWIEEVAAGLDKLPFRFTGKEMDEETGLYYYGARYLDPKYSRWLSGDPALGEYIPSAGADTSKLAGMGGVFNVVNLHLYHYAGNNPVKYIDPDGKESGYILDNEGAQGFGHAGMYVQTKDGKYAFFEVTGISKEANGIESNISPGSTVKDKWGHDTTVLSNLPLKFPTQGSAQSMGQPTRAGCLLRTFDKREDMIAALQEMDFDEMIVFKTQGREDAKIYDKAFVEGQSFSGYQVFNDSCGIFARNALTVQGSGIKAINPFVNINNIFSSSIPNEIGANLYLANPESTIIRWRQK